MTASKAASPVVLASSNKGKLRELDELLAPLGFEIQPQSKWDIEDAIEDGLSFVENAIIKARHASKLTGLAAISDDSGLEVDILNGAPGIYSARFCERSYGMAASDANNVEALIKKLGEANAWHKTPPPPIAARYQCVLVYMSHWEDPTPIIASGTWEGEIIAQGRGTSGFGYDPIFYCRHEGLTAAEMDSTQKRILSHRSQASKRLGELLAAKLR